MKYKGSDDQEFIQEKPDPVARVYPVTELQSLPASSALTHLWYFS